MQLTHKIRSNILKIALFATGLSGIVAEYILSTLATYFLGNSVFQWTMIVSIMLFSMGLGSRISKYFERNLLQKFITIEFFLSILAAYVSLLTYTTSAFGIYTGLVIYGLSIIIGLLIGMEIPLVIRLNDAFEELRINVSSILEKDYYGSLLGGVFFAFVGLPYLGLTYTPFILGTINFLVALLLFFMLWKHIETNVKRKFTAFACAITLALLGGVIVSKPLISFGEERRYTDRVVYTEQSKYQKIVLTRNKNDYWLFINGNQQLSTVDEEMYHEPLVLPLMSLHRYPKNILVLGGGDGCAVREILKYPSVEEVVLVDLDPAMTDLGKTHPVLLELNEGVLNDSLVQVINEDAFSFMERSKQYFDVIIIDLPDPKTVELGRLYSFEFYKLCYKQLRPDGLIITQATSPYYASRAFKCIEISMQEAGFSTVPMHNQVLTLGEWGWIAGSKALSAEAFKRALQSLHFDEIETKWLNHDAMTLMTSFGKDVFLDAGTEVEVNKIHNPVLYQYYRKGKWELY
ncbi:polyamine aminopropyltransferase [Fulvivirgaceae bacterium BMA10]|uniref:Polyamine aminopropyltransferase n=1 Tax=Splendidivirga corallicola TaxID=3051826 RepID=A0ABT8KK49_9BACT|nr:polyamine aminopropyltransferase [Fulvivirgaceae bacterium BMA10]